MNLSVEERALVRALLAQHIASCAAGAELARGIVRRMDAPSLRKGSKVRYLPCVPALDKNDPARTGEVGSITSHPRHDARTVYVQWPSGWGGHVRVEDLEVVA